MVSPGTLLHVHVPGGVVDNNNNNNNSAMVFSEDAFATKANAADIAGNQFDWASTYARMWIDGDGNVGIG